MTTNDHKQIIEVMGHAAGEASDGLHLLRLAQCIFGLLASSDFFFEFLVCFCQIPRTQLSRFGHVHRKCHHSSEQYSGNESHLRQWGSSVSKSLWLRPRVGPPCDLLKLNVGRLHPFLIRLAAGRSIVDLLITVVDFDPIVRSYVLQNRRKKGLVAKGT